MPVQIVALCYTLMCNQVYRFQPSKMQAWKLQSVGWTCILYLSIFLSVKQMKDSRSAHQLQHRSRPVSTQSRAFTSPWVSQTFADTQAQGGIIAFIQLWRRTHLGKWSMRRCCHFLRLYHVHATAYIHCQLNSAYAALGCLSDKIFIEKGVLLPS